MPKGEVIGYNCSYHFKLYLRWKVGGDKGTLQKEEKGSFSKRAPAAGRYRMRGRMLYEREAITTKTDSKSGSMGGWKSFQTEPF